MASKLRAWWNRVSGWLTADREVESKGKAEEVEVRLQDAMEDAGVIGPPKGKEGDGSA